MAVIHTVNTSGTVGLDALKAFSALAWSWFRANENTVVAKRWILSIRVRDLRWVFESLFGPEPL